MEGTINKYISTLSTRAAWILGQRLADLNEISAANTNI